MRPNLHRYCRGGRRCLEAGLDHAFCCSHSQGQGQVVRSELSRFSRLCVGRAMKIRKAAPGDAGPASLVMRRSISELCLRDHENDPAILQSWLGNKTPEKFTEWAEAADDFCCVAVGDDGAILGVAYLARSGEIRLNYVSPDARFR